MKTVQVDNAALYLRLNDEENKIEPVMTDAFKQWCLENKVNLDQVTAFVDINVDGAPANVGFYVQFDDDADAVAFKLGWPWQCISVHNNN